MLKQVQFEVDPPIFEFRVYANSPVDTDETIARVATLIFDSIFGVYRGDLEPKIRGVSGHYKHTKIQAK